MPPVQLLILGTAITFQYRNVNTVLAIPFFYFLIFFFFWGGGSEVAEV